MRRLIHALQSQIRYKIILPYLALTFLVTLVGAAIALSLAAASWQERLNSQLAQMGRNTTEALVQRERDHLDWLRQMAEAPANPETGTPSIIDAFGSNNPDVLPSVLSPYYGLTLEAIDIDRLVAFDFAGRAKVDWMRVSADKDEPPLRLLDTDLSQVDSVRKVLRGELLNGNDKFSALIYFGSDEQPYFCTVVPVKDGRQIIGGLLVGIKIDQLLPLLERRSQAIFTTFYDLEGRAIGSSVLGRTTAVGSTALADDDRLENFTMSQQTLDRFATVKAQTVLDTRLVRHREYELAYSPLVISGDKVGYFSVGLARDFQVDPVSLSRNAIIAITMVLMISAVLLGYWLARQITLPLTALVESAEAVTAGDLEHRSVVRSNDELGLLSSAFNEMTEHLLRLYQTSRALSSLIDVTAVLDVTSRTLASILPGAEVAALVNSRNTWTCHLSSQPREALGIASEIPLVPDPALLAELAHRREPYTLSVASDPRVGALPLIEHGHYGSVLITPLVLDDTLVGLLIFGHARPDAFGAASEPTVLALANMAASVLCNAVLFERINEEAGERRAILQSIADGVVVCDTHRNIVLVNQAAEKLLGLNDWERARPNFSDVPLERVPLERDLFGRDQSEIEHYRLGDRVFTLSRAPVITDANRWLGEVVVLHDISAEVAVDRAKTDFIATISHELRTPLTVINGYTELLLRGMVGELTADQRDLLDNVRVRAMHMSGLVKNVVMVASIEANTLMTEVEPQDLWVTVEHVTGPMRAAFASKGLTLTISLPEDLPPILADREQLNLVLSQLLDNARRYTQQGGVTVRACRQGAMIQIDITDTGIGIPSNEICRLFTRFHRVEGNNSPERGSGLGLAIARQLVERLGGRVWVQSEVGVGSTFSLALPIADRTMDDVVEHHATNTTAP